MSEMTLSDIASKLKKIDFCMMSTKGSQAEIANRPMSHNGDVEYDGDSWFFSYAHTRKIIDIGRDSGVTLSFTEPPSLLGKPGIFISIEGKAELIRDKTLSSSTGPRILTAGFLRASRRLGSCSSKCTRAGSNTGMARKTAPSLSDASASTPGLCRGGQRLRRAFGIITRLSRPMPPSAQCGELLLGRIPPAEEELTGRSKVASTS